MKKQKNGQSENQNQNLIKKIRKIKSKIINIYYFDFYKQVLHFFVLFKCS